MIIPEIRLQSELYLPIKEISRLFNRLYDESLSYAPILSSTSFHACPSWTDCFSALPFWLQFSPNPARFLERLLEDQQLLTRFLFFSFLPSRFNGAGFGRYPDQLDWLRHWLSKRADNSLRILDAACGSGEGTWELAEVLAGNGWQPEQVQLEGWTLEPLEVWAAENRCLPHQSEREKNYQQRVQSLLEQGWGDRINFRAVDLLATQIASAPFDLILCNGLLGGPILHEQSELQQVLLLFVSLLAPGGMLLMADHFHDGWKKQVSEETFVGLLTGCGLKSQQAGEGLAAQKTHPVMLR